MIARCQNIFNKFVRHLLETVGVFRHEKDEVFVNLHTPTGLEKFHLRVLLLMLH